MADVGLIIRDARLRGEGSVVDISIADGKIAAMGPALDVNAAQTLQADGNLVTESFANPHLHLDKVYTLKRLGEAALQDYHGESMGKAMAAIELASWVKAEYDQTWILENVRRALNLAVRFGNTHIRAFADVDSKAGLEGVRALLAAKREFEGRVSLQVVAFPQDGVVREPGAAELVEQAVSLGADVVGGIPWIEYTDQDARTHIDEMFRIAQAYDRDVSMLVDDAGDAGLRTLEMLAVKTLQVGWQGRVLAHHARAMQLYPQPYFQKIAALLRAAGVGMVSDPHTGPLHARVRDLRQEGVLVCLGQDDITDAYYPFGRNNMLEVAFLAAHLLWMTTAADMQDLYDMISLDAARAMGLPDFRLAVGAPANLVVLREATVLDALRNHEPPRHVVSHGRMIEAEL